MNMGMRGKIVAGLLVVIGLATVGLLLFLNVTSLHAKQIAAPKEGQTVVLKSDGTLDFGKETENSIAATTHRAGEENSTLAFETGFVFASGDVKPIARTTFYLLDEDLVKILKEAGLQIPQSFPRKSVNAEWDLLNIFSMSLNSSHESFAEFHAAAAALKPHIVQSVKTNFDGKALFKPVAAGTYYLMGLVRRSYNDPHVGQQQNPWGNTMGRIDWNVKVELKPGYNVVTLDQDNASLILGGFGLR